MIILDTNILSEALRPSPQPEVMAWLDRQASTSLFTTTVTRGELLYGMQLLPEGQRKNDLAATLKAILDQDMSGRVLSFDNAAADAYALIAVSRKSAGQPISQFDAMIAAIARVHGASLATRNTKDFTDCGIELINPWDL